MKKYWLTPLQLECASSEKGISNLREAYNALRDANAGLEKTNKWLDSEDELLEQMPLLDREKIKGWKAIWSSDGGWLAAAKAINAIGDYIRDKGVNFAFGDSGSFKKPILENAQCIGVETIDGTQYHADSVVLAAGAWSPALVDLQGQCVSKVRALDCYHNTQD